MATVDESFHLCHLHLELEDLLFELIDVLEVLVEDAVRVLDESSMGCQFFCVFGNLLCSAALIVLQLE